VAGTLAAARDAELTAPSMKPSRRHRAQGGAQGGGGAGSRIDWSDNDIHPRPRRCEGASSHFTRKEGDMATAPAVGPGLIATYGAQPGARSRVARLGAITGFGGNGCMPRKGAALFGTR